MSIQDKLNENRKKLGMSTKIISKQNKFKDKFQKRSTEILEKVYEEREKRSKTGSMGKSIFNYELLDKYGIEEYFPHQSPGDHFFDILPISFDPLVPYVFEASVHFGVGFAQDAFLCPHIMQRKSCYRCEQQAKLYKKKDELLREMTEEKFKDMTKRLYPSDRALFLIWERTKELLGEAPPEHILKVYNAPKTKVHAEIQSKVRDKINRTTLDISDVSPNGEGRTISMEVIRQGDFPNYKGIDLHKRENPIPDEILEQLDQLISDAEEAGYKTAIEYLLYNADSDEIKESMLTEEMEEEKDNKEDQSERKSSFSKFKKNKQEESKTQTSAESVDDVLREIELEITKLNEQLHSLKSFQLKIWCKNNGYEEALDLFDDQEAMIEAIVEDKYEKLIAEADINI